MRKKLGKTLLTLAVALAVGLGFTAPISFSARAAGVYTVSPAERFQTVDGWGSSLIWWAGQVGGYDWEGDDGREVRDQIMDLVYGKDGLDFNIARYNVGGGDNPDCEYNTDGGTHMQRGRNMEGFRTAEDGEYDWSADANQRWTLDWINKNVDDAVVEYFSNSPPWFMTRSGCVSGATQKPSRENLKDGYEEAFATYFVDVLEHLITVDGVKIDYINPFNESTSTWWPIGGSQEGCYFNNAQRDTILKSVIRQVDERGLDVEITATDCTGATSAYAAYNALSPEVKERVTKLNYHLYEDGDNLEAHAAMKRQSEWDGQKVWMSEMGYNLDDHLDAVPMKTAFRHSSQIRSLMRDGGVNAYVLWQIIEEMATQMGVSSNYGPIKVSFYDREETPELAQQGFYEGSYEIDKQYYVLGQYSKYIKAGYYITTTSDESALAAVSPDGSEVVIVRENTGASSETATYMLDGYTVTSAEAVYTDETHNWAHKTLSPSGSGVGVTITPSSVTTIILKTTPVTGDRVFVDDSRGAILTDAGLMEENRFYYSEGWSNLNEGTKDADAYYYATHYAGPGNTAEIKFTGTGIDVYGIKKSDSASAAKFSIDGEPAEIINCSQSNKEYGLLWSKTGLEKGEHVLKITIEGIDGNNWLNLDGAFIQKDPAVRADTLLPSNLAGHNGRLVTEFVAPAGEYEVEYKEIDSGAWTAVAAGDAVSGSGEECLYRVTAGTDLAAGSYLVRVKSGDAVGTAVAVELAAASDLLYYVDCGSVGGYTQYESAAVYNSSKERAFGKDFATGKSWGLVSTKNATYDFSKAGPYSSIGSLISADNSTEKAIIYKFEVGTTGSYDVVLGTQNGWAAYPRTLKIDVNGTAKNAYISGTDVNLIFLKGIAPDGDGYITVKLTNGGGGEPVLGTIMIADHSNPVPAYALAAATDKGDGIVTVANAEFDYGQAMNLNSRKAYQYLSDGTYTEEAATFETSIAPGKAEAVTGTLSGTLSASGLAFSSPILFHQTGTPYLYRIDSGTDGTNTIPLGSLQTGAEHDRDGADGGWGYLESAGAEWRSDSYDTSIRHAGTKQQRYRLTGLPAGKTVEITLGSNSVSWGGRTFDVYINGDGSYPDNDDAPTADSAGYAGTVTLTGANYQKQSVKASVTVPDDGTLYVVCYNRAAKQHPQIAYIDVFDPNFFEAAPSAPKTDKTEAERDETVRLSGLITDAQVFVTAGGKLVDTFTAAASTHSLDLSAYVLDNASNISVFQRVAASNTDSGPATVSFPGVDCTGISEDWAERNVLRFVPTGGVVVDTITVTAPSGKTEDITLHEYYYYRAYENGEHTVRLTTKSGRTFVRTFDLDYVDELRVTAAGTSETWTDGDVIFTVTPVAASGIASVTMNGETQEIKDSYTVTATENKDYEFVVTTIGGRVMSYTVSVKNIDKTAPVLALTPDFAFVGGFRAEVSTQSLSGGEVTVTHGDQTVKVQDTFTALESGDYTITFTNRVGTTAVKTFSLSYNADALKLMTATVEMGESGAKVTATGEGGATVKLIRIGGEALTGTGSWETAGGKYMLYAEKGDAAEAFVFTVTTAGDDGSTDTEAKGCGGVLPASGGPGGTMLLIGLMAVSLAAASLRIKKGGKVR